MNRTDAFSVPVTSFLGAFQCLRKEVRPGCPMSPSGETADRPAAFGKPTATATPTSCLEPPDPELACSDRLLWKDLETLLRNGGFGTDSLTTAASSRQVFLKRWRRPSAPSPTSTTRTFNDWNVGLGASLSSSSYGLCPASAYLEALEELWTVCRRSAATASSAEQPQRLALADQLWSRLLLMQTAVLSARDMARRTGGEHDDDDSHDSKPWLICRMTLSESMELNKFDLACSPEHSKSAPMLSECGEKSSSEDVFRAPLNPSAESMAHSLVEPPLEENARAASTVATQSPRPTRLQTALVERNLSNSNEIQLRLDGEDALDRSAFTAQAWSASPGHQQAAFETFHEDLTQRTNELVLEMPSSSPDWGLVWIPGALVIRPLLGALKATATSGSAVAATLEILDHLLQQGAARGLVLDEQRDLAVLPVARTLTDRKPLVPSTVFIDQLMLLGRRWLDAYARSRVLPQLVATLTRWYQQRSTAATHEGALVNFLRLLETIVQVGFVPLGALAIDAQQTPMHSKSEDVDGDQVTDPLPFAVLQSILMLCLHIAIGRARHRSFLLRRRGEEALVTLTRRLFQWHFCPEIREWMLRLLAAMIDPCIADITAVVSAEKSESFKASERPSSASASEALATSVDLELRHALWGEEASGRPATEWISLGLLSSSSDAARRRHETQILGLRILQTVLDAVRETPRLHSETVLTRIGALRSVVLGPISIAMLRCCASSGEANSTEVLTRALPLSLKLVECLGSHAFSFFHALLTIVIPSHLSMRSESVHRAAGSLREELVFQVLRQLGSRLDLLWSAYLAYDCSLKFMDAVEPLFDTLAASRHPFAAQVLGTVLEMLQRPDYGPCPLLLPIEVSDWEALCLQKKSKRHRREVLRSIPFVSSKEGECSASELWRHLEENLPMNDAERRDAVSTLALFLRHTPELDKALIGQVIGSPDQFSQQVLASYAATFDLRNLSIDVALRLFLESFRLPGESQKIDRIMQAFANHYFVQNRGARLPLASADATHVLSFAIIMLNTDQHHDQVKHRMTVNDFIRNNRGLNDGKDLPSDYLSGIYERIQQSEIRLSDDHGLTALDAVHWEAQLRTQEQLERVRPGRLELSGDRRQDCTNASPARLAVSPSKLWVPFGCAHLASSRSTS
ncbi:hypothetical protein F1559_004857 [Cyanidiococcus yangmingshanensis]|uniref:SEC7 domain-containing protein n=1 Tax=Cyanidiococcus yangmingshanensis TaxID=2690220 RepID=A0A7J7IPG1_9RHOD|nr:hypothetical protein F1559_004857 [Cyanidiococcus yangmingshanensis]